MRSPAIGLTRILHYLVQQTTTQGSLKGGIHFENDGRREVSAIRDPRLAYEALFTGFTPPSSGGTTPDPMVDEQAVRELRSRRSVLDLVSSSTERLLPRLGNADRERLELHFDQIRDLETRLDRLDTTARPTGAGCAAVDIGSGLDQRGAAEAFARLIVTSWACDLSSVTALSMTQKKCWMAMSEISSLPSDAHEATHSAGREVEQLNVALHWLIGQFAHITQLARETPDADGGSLLDNAAMGLFFEGGFGLDPSTGQERRAHSTENMVIFVSGRAGGLRGGEHILGERRHPASGDDHSAQRGRRRDRPTGRDQRNDSRTHRLTVSISVVVTAFATGSKWRLGQERPSPMRDTEMRVTTSPGVPSSRFHCAVSRR